MFRKIGQYEITREDDLLLVWSSAEFNLESAQEYAEHMMRMIDSMPHGFGVLARFDDAPILGPEVEASMHETAKVRARRGMRAVALVTPVTGGLAVARGQWGRIYDGTGVSHAFFTDLVAARAWLRAQLDQS